MKQTAIFFEVYQLDAYHYRIEARKNSPQSSDNQSPAVFYLPLRELYIQRDLREELLEAIIEFVEKRFGEIRTIIECVR